MPELPEVETIRCDLEKTLVGRKVLKVHILGSSSVRHSSKKFCQQLEGQTVQALGRRAKLLIIVLGDDLFMLIHLKMTGQLIHVKKQQVMAGAWGLKKPEKGLSYETFENSPQRLTAQDLPNPWTRVIFDLDDQSQLYFNDIRRFGYLQLVNQKEKKKIIETYGIEPLTTNYTLESFKNIFKNRQAPLKSLLLNQKLIAGLGNIYVDEACFLAGVRPTKRAHRLTQKEIEKLFESAEQVICQAVAFRGTSFRDYRDAQGEKGQFVSRLFVYGRQGEPCQNCQTLIKKITLSGRGTHYCSVCQK